MPLTSILALVASAAHIALALAVSAHIVLTKDDVRAAIGWTGLVWLTPVFGSVLYALFGVNRISREAGRMRGRVDLPDEDRAEVVRSAQALPAHNALPPGSPENLVAIARVSGTVSRQPIEGGCRIEPLMNGDEAYPAMLEAIDSARRSVALASYIFDRGESGTAFAEALARAVARGVAVRVLLDGVGARYSHPPITRELTHHHVPVARFLPSLIPVPHPYFNLRNHRKLLVVDGRIGFCGGMNIRDVCVLARHLPGATQDLHFRVRGPVVRHLLHAFTLDWSFAKHEQLDGPAWAVDAGPDGTVLARGIPDGPDENFETLAITILGAISQARQSVRVLTPYFLPDRPLVDALRVAALRGVAVDIVLPERGNLRLVEWAATAQLPQVLAWGCRVYLSRPPFDHSKLLVIDGEWSLIGSSNWDPRSLRLNFEYDVECYSAELAARLNRIIDDKIATGRLLTLQELEARSLLTRVRDGFVWLAQPYL